MRIIFYITTKKFLIEVSFRKMKTLEKFGHTNILTSQIDLKILLDSYPVTNCPLPPILMHFIIIHFNAHWQVETQYHNNSLRLSTKNIL